MNPEQITYFAKTDSRNKQIPFGIKQKDRVQHIYVIGKTGMGKSTLLENMAVQDIRNGEGFAFMDPHGKSAELLLEYIPESRVQDVLYFGPFDMDHPIAFNVMEDVGYDKRHLVVSGLMSAFKKIWVDAWSARMEYILQNTLLALLEYPGATMLGVNRMYTDKTYRRKVVDNVKDPLVRDFWEKEFATYTDRYTLEATPAIQNKVGQFTGNPLIRNIVGQPKSTFDLRQIIDNRKILIVNLSKGKIGEGNANLLGSMLITKLYLAALSRADVGQSTLAQLPNFYLYVDEFQSFANESFADILSEARKYKLNLTIAHQYIEQMPEEVRAAVFGNVGTMITFRVGAYDAEVLEKEFAPQFSATDLVNLGFAQIYLKLMIDGVSSQPFSAVTLPPIAPPAASYKERVIENSRRVYARPRAVVEEEIRREYAASSKPEAGTGKEAKTKKPDRGVAERPRNDRAATRQERYRDERPEKTYSKKYTAPQRGDFRIEKKDTNEMDPGKETISLNQLQRHDPPKKATLSENRKDKGATEGSKRDLRAALAGILGDRKTADGLRGTAHSRQDAGDKVNLEPKAANQKSDDEVGRKRNDEDGRQAEKQTVPPAKSWKESESPEKKPPTVEVAKEMPKAAPREISEEELRKILDVEE
jgi:energy-coupling factor transporter ATP-binding protein EcfA2